MRRTLTIMALALSFSAAQAADTSVQEANKRTVLDFYEKGLNQKDFDAASVHFGPRYVQHNPMAPDGIDGFRSFIGMLKDRFPKSRSEIKKVFADGDYVILHVHAVREPGTAGSAIVDIFKLEEGKIVEHWDVIQAIPDKMAHANGMF